MKVMYNSLGAAAAQAKADLVGVYCKQNALPFPTTPPVDSECFRVFESATELSIEDLVQEFKDAATTAAEEDMCPSNQCDIYSIDEEDPSPPRTFEYYYDLTMKIAAELLDEERASTESLFVEALAKFDEFEAVLWEERSRLRQEVVRTTEILEIVYGNAQYANLRLAPGNKVEAPGKSDLLTIWERVMNAAPAVRYNDPELESFVAKWSHDEGPLILYQHNMEYRTLNEEDYINAGVALNEFMTAIFESAV
jgi:hypothetical protein